MDVGCEWFYSPNTTRLPTGASTFSKSNDNNIIFRDIIANSSISSISSSSNKTYNNQTNNHNNHNHNKHQQLISNVGPLISGQTGTALSPSSPIAAKVAATGQPQLQLQLQLQTNNPKRPRPSSLNINQIRLLNKSYGDCWQHHDNQTNNENENDNYNYNYIQDYNTTTTDHSDTTQQAIGSHRDQHHHPNHQLGHHLQSNKHQPHHQYWACREQETFDEYDEFDEERLEEQLLLGGSSTSGSTSNGSKLGSSEGVEQASDCSSNRLLLLDDSVNCSSASEYTDILDNYQESQEDKLHNNIIVPLNSKHHNKNHNLQYYQHQFKNKKSLNHTNNDIDIDSRKPASSCSILSSVKQTGQSNTNNTKPKEQTLSSNLKLNFLSKFLISDYLDQYHQHYHHHNQHHQQSTTSNKKLNSSLKDNDIEHTNKQVTMATVRPISPQYQHTLDSAISLAKELASKNMADSGESSPKTPNSPDKKRFNFKLKHFSKSFSEASANIRDIESSISNDEKQAYELLIGRGSYNSSSSSSSSFHQNNSSLSSSSSSSGSSGSNSSHARSSSYTMNHHYNQSNFNQTGHNNNNNNRPFQTHLNHPHNQRSRPQPFGYGGACGGNLHYNGTGPGASAGASASNTFTVKKSFFM